MFPTWESCTEQFENYSDTQIFFFFFFFFFFVCLFVCFLVFVFLFSFFFANDRCVKKTRKHNLPYKILCYMLYPQNFNPYISNGLFFQNSLEKSISSRRVSGQFLSIPCFLEISVFNANIVDPDQTPHCVASDLGLHCLLMFLLGDTRHNWFNVSGVYMYNINCQNYQGEHALKYVFLRCGTWYHNFLQSPLNSIFI